MDADAGAQAPLKITCLQWFCLPVITPDLVAQPSKHAAAACHICKCTSFTFCFSVNHIRASSRFLAHTIQRACIQGNWQAVAEHLAFVLNVKGVMRVIGSQLTRMRVSTNTASPAGTIPLTISQCVFKLYTDVGREGSSEVNCVAQLLAVYRDISHGS